MTTTLQRWLFGLVAAIVAADMAWAALGHFRIDTLAYVRVAVLASALLGGGLYYQRKRSEPALAAMLMGTAFLCTFSAGASVLNYFLLTVAGRRIDNLLAAADHALGFDWYRMMLAIGHHPLLNQVLFRAYNVALPEIAVLLVALAWCGRAESIYRYCLAIASGALICVFLWTLAPSFGAMSLHALPPGFDLPLSVDAGYGKALVALLHDGPGFISPAELRGLIGFPSYHGVLALLAAWYGWQMRLLRWPLLLVNLLVLVATPVQGGHHLIDVLAAFPVAALAVFIAGSVENVKLVNKPSSVYEHSARMAAIPYHHDTDRR
ncbi:MAG TPA: phosphatase PAP2 family protein [Rhizomicrobium sp.]|jgi:hypothetical protein